MATKPPPAWMVRVNTALLRRGLRLGSQHLLTVAGRRTGLPRSTPVSLATDGGDRFIVAAVAEAAWVANVRAAGHGTLARGRAIEAVAFEQLEPADRGPVIAAFLDQVRGGVRFFGAGTRAEIVAAADQYPVFRVIPAPAAPAAD